jgi:hypothetical protein
MALALLLLPVATACIASTTGASSTTPSAAQSFTRPQVGEAAAESSTTAVIYAAVIRRLVTKDHGFGAAPSPYRQVYVLNGAVPGAGRASVLVSKPGRPFPSKLTAQIVAALKRLPPVTFVSTRGAAMIGSPPGRVANRGVLITLAPVRWTGPQTASVPNNRWATGLNGQWITYKLRYTAGSWRVTGVDNSSPVAIS